MKTTISFKRMTFIALLGAAFAAPVLAQPGPGMGGMGSGPGMQNADPGTGMGPGMGQGRGAVGRGGRGMRFNQNNITGWTLMTPEERTAQQAKMRAVKTYDECKAIQTEHRTIMETRAKERGVTLPFPRQNGCDVMKARGLIK